MTGSAKDLTRTVTTLAFKPMLAAAGPRGRELEASLGDLPAPPSLETHVPLRRWTSAWEQLAELRPGRAVAIDATEHSRLADLQVFGFLAATASSLAEAFARIARFRPLWARGIGWRLHEGDGEFALELLRWPDTSPGARLAREHLVAEMVQSMREIVGARLVPRCVELSSPAPPNRAAFDAFFGLQVSFDAGRDAVAFDADVANLPVRIADSDLHTYFVTACERLTRDQSADDDWLHKARHWLATAHADGPPTAAALARSLGMSERTLRRRLREADTSFRALRDEVAVELANAYLRRRSLSASEVAFLLGFSEPSAFFRAYRRWTGETPRSYQERQRADST
jgi:AraC-like DNA-binding protein